MQGDMAEKQQRPSDAVDLERRFLNNEQLANNTVQSYSWRDCHVVVKDRKTGQPKSILTDASGIVKAGEMVALMGPSGSGKTTLLNVLARRAASANATAQQTLLVNGSPVSIETFRSISSFVEQYDALIGSLTVRETIDFAARLANSRFASKTDRRQYVGNLVDQFGLQNCADTLIGTPLRKGISGGQKRRVSVASHLVTAPKILFLDEPTSGLDSAASYEVMSLIKVIAQRTNLIVIASIHQPSTTTFNLFDQAILLSNGRTCYNGPVSSMTSHFNSLGHNMPLQINPAEFVLDLINTDFAHNNDDVHARLQTIQDGWDRSESAHTLLADIEAVRSSAKEGTLVEESEMVAQRSFLATLLAVLHRSFIKSYRDVIVYGIRIAMYLGLAIMMGTVWLRLKSEQEYIQPFINAIFFGSAFMSFMAVAYVPAYLEDRAVFVKERANGLYGSTVFVLSNFIMGIPYLFLIAVLFSIISYWLSNFQPTAHAFFMWVMWLFLDLLAAEGLVVLASSLLPNFVVALAIVAFANGLWMSVGGFLVSPKVLNVFWRYVFHYIDYQAYVFRGMMVNEFEDRTFSCGSSCQCMYPSELTDQCKISGVTVLAEYGYKPGNTGKWVGIMLGIIAGYRVLGWVVLHFKRT